MLSNVSSPQLDPRTHSIKFSASYIVDINKLILKFIWREKRLKIVNTILKQRDRVGRLILPNFKTYYKATVIKTV